MRKKWPLRLAIVLLIAGYFLMRITTPPTTVNVPATGENVSIIGVNLHPDRQTFTNTASGFSFQYPEMFSGNVWRPLAWPPMVTVVPMDQDPIAIGCPDFKNVSQTGTDITGTTADGLNYILHPGSDVGAGQLYSAFCYVIQGLNEQYVFDITIHSANGCGEGNCGPYCGTPNEQECMNLDRAKTIDGPINEIISTFKVIK